jgi:acetyl esterase/lipase
MRRRDLLAVLAAGSTAGLALLSGCSLLSAFNAIVPQDNGVARVISDAAYGPDPRQRVDVYRPVSPARDLPIIVFFYGGSWNSGDKSGYSWVGRALAARGFVVAIPNYRLVPKVRYPAFVEDGASAVRLIIRIAESLGGDSNRIILAGHSAGAYNAAMLAYDEQWLGRDRARVRGFIGLAGPYDFLPLDGPAVEAAFAGAADLKATQPIEHVDRNDPPAFLGIASEDRTIHPKNAINFGGKLRAASVPVEIKSYPRVGHAGLVTAIAKPLRGRANVLNDIAEFARAESAEAQTN